MLRSAVYATPLFRCFAPRYRNTYVPAHLCRLIDLLDQTVDVPGSVIEIGCWRGETTVWLKKHMETTGVEKHYYALDTFKGFTKNDLDYEIANRGKKLREIAAFESNRKSWFDKTMRINGFHNVTSIKEDATKFDYSTLAPIAFALVDLDLYLPMKKTLEAVFPFLSRGGVLVADDCERGIVYDGALQAFTEFASDHDVPVRIDLNRLGVIVKK